MTIHENVNAANEADAVAHPSAFTGIRVLDFTRAQQGPFGTLLLCDMGADVIKVEPPGGEDGRANGLGPDGFSSYFEGHNRGKRSITLDLKVPEAIEIVRGSCRPSMSLSKTSAPASWSGSALATKT